MIVKGKTKSGFEFETDDRIFNDYKFVYLCRKCRSKDAVISNDAGIDLALMILGEEHLEELMEHCKDEDGYSSIDSVTNELAEIETIVAEKSAAAKKS